MNKITMKKFKGDLNGTLSYFGAYGATKEKSQLEDIGLWFVDFSKDLKSGDLRLCTAKSNCLVFKNKSNDNSYLYFDQKNEKRSFYYMENSKYKLYLMEATESTGTIYYMGYILNK